MSWTTDILDVLSPAEARSAVLGIDDAGEATQWDEQLSLANTAVARQLDRMCGAIVVRTVSAEEHEGYVDAIWTNWGAVTTWTTVLEYAGTTPVTLTQETLGTRPGTAFLPDRDRRDGSLFTGRIRRRTAGLDVPFFGPVVITYTAGRYATTAAVDQRFKKAAGLMLANYWRGIAPSMGQAGPYDVPVANFPTFAVPQAVEQLLVDDMRRGVSVGMA